MNVTYAFAGLAVIDRDASLAWFERLFGHAPDLLPNDAEAAWRLTDSSSLYIVADPPQAGRGVVTLMVEDLEATLAELLARGIEAGRIDEISGAGRKAVFADPDGNTVAIVELIATQ